MDLTCVKAKLTKVGGFAIYRLVSDSGAESWEVHRVRVKRISSLLAKSPSYRDYTHFYQLPSNEDFGRYGWAFQHRSDAEKEYAELVSAEDNL